MMFIKPPNIGFGLVEFVTIIAILSVYYLRLKEINNIQSISYVFLSSWLAFLQVPVAVIWNRSLPFIVDILTLIFFWGIDILRIIILYFAIKPAIHTVFATNDVKEDDS